MVTGTQAAVETDLARGGRWTSLRVGGREWLWQRADPGRHHVRPGDAFVDAGGLEECVPTVRGTPDHGAAWSREWHRYDDEDVVDCADFVLRRRLSSAGDTVEARYRLVATPGYRFIWAAHALLDLAVGARVVLPPGLAVRVYPEAAPLLTGDWPAGAPYVVGEWPRPRGLDLGGFGPDDGTAVGGTVLDADAVEIVDGDTTLRMHVDADPGVPVSVSIWRNLDGYPVTGPYRSAGVEPMLGRVFDLADAGPGDAATVPNSGQLEWILRVSGR
jgi:hypothetical protein